MLPVHARCRRRQIHMIDCGGGCGKGVVFPGWVSEVEGRRRHYLAVTWNQRETGVDGGDEIVKGDRTIEKEDTGDGERDLPPFQVEEGSVYLREAVAQFGVGFHRQLAWQATSSSSVCAAPTSSGRLPRCQSSKAMRSSSWSSRLTGASLPGMSAIGISWSSMASFL